ncbi:MAG TPA: hypothetical protein ENN96_00950 [Candidatus Acetothermia bacterium]|nr:hypothetical protein [Candidatus Acetothermia bacterium]
MRKQYHFRSSERGLLAWDVDRLIERAAGLTPMAVPLAALRELDETFWFSHDGVRPTCREVALHAKLMNEADLRFPILLSQDGRVMDGMHRVCRAFMEGRESILAVQFAEDPPPDSVGVDPDDLPY